MNFDRLNRWLTLGGNLGVLLGLGALIFEINQSNAIAIAEMEQARSDGFREWRQEWATNDHLVPLAVEVESLLNEKGASLNSTGALDVHERQAVIAAVLSELEPEDNQRFRFAIISEYWDYENLYAQYKRELITEEYWLDRGIGGVLNRAPMWKAIVGGGLPKGRQSFNDEIERLLKVCPGGLREECDREKLL